jgi:site-specific recombinase XerD
MGFGNVHLDPDDPYIKVMGKGQKEREIGPLGELSRGELAHYLGTYRTGAELADPVFLNRFGRPLTVDGGLEDMIATLGKRANIEGVRCSPHTLRHTYAVSHLLQSGDLFKLSLLMGPTDIETTQIYLRTIQSRQVRNGKSVLDELKVK